MHGPKNKIVLVTVRYNNGSAFYRALPNALMKSYLLLTGPISLTQAGMYMHQFSFSDEKFVA